MTKPSQFLKMCRQDMSTLSAEICEGYLLRLSHVEHSVYLWDAIPSTIPARYHDGLKRTCELITLNEMFDKARQKYSLAQKHAILEKCL